MPWRTLLEKDPRAGGAYEVAGVEQPRFDAEEEAKAVAAP